MSEVTDLKNIINIVANLCNLQFFENIFVSTVLTDLLPTLLEIDVYVRYTIMHV